jgi:hypothetical protein
MVPPLMISFVKTIFNVSHFGYKLCVFNSVLELGAGGALPSLIATLKGALRVFSDEL